METLAQGGASATTPQLSPQSSCASFDALREGTLRAALPLSAVAQALHSRERLPADLAPIDDWHRNTLHESQSSSSGEADGPGLSRTRHSGNGEVPQQSLEGACSSDTESQRCQPTAHSRRCQGALPDVKHQQVWHAINRFAESRYASARLVPKEALASAIHDCCSIDMTDAPLFLPEAAYAGCELGRHC